MDSKFTFFGMKKGNFLHHSAFNEERDTTLNSLLHSDKDKYLVSGMAIDNFRKRSPRNDYLSHEWQMTEKVDKDYVSRYNHYYYTHHKDKWKDNNKSSAESIDKDLDEARELSGDIYGNLDQITGKYEDVGKKLKDIYANGSQEDIEQAELMVAEMLRNYDDDFKNRMYWWIRKGQGLIDESGNSASSKSSSKKKSSEKKTKETTEKKTKEKTASSDKSTKATKDTTSKKTKEKKVELSVGSLDPEEDKKLKEKQRRLKGGFRE